ncbi:MAG: hemerythrin family protein [Deltaproteobacteria bacterium]|nr:hemerythrin family protein [Deltaproteobacteria bacterium]
MALIVWNSEYSVGVKSIDEQHKKLVGFVNELNDAMLTGKGRPVLDKILQELITHTAAHFEDEDLFMHQAECSDYLAHIAEHKQLVKEILAYQKKFREGGVTINPNIMEFFRNWLTTHILKSDKKSFAQMNSKGIV